MSLLRIYTQRFQHALRWFGLSLQFDREQHDVGNQMPNKEWGEVEDEEEIPDENRVPKQEGSALEEGRVICCQAENLQGDDIGRREKDEVPDYGHA